MIDQKDYSKWNTILGWVSFMIASTVYLLTVEPTASWWDCGEYIATAYKLQVGHPPGAPTFQLLGRLFSLLAFGDTSRVALMINVMSAISSSLTIMFLFWTITMLAKKLVAAAGEMTGGKALAILGSGFVGAMAFTFSDSFWFSAGEGEVYAMSSLITAVTFWAILRWEQVADEKHALKWLILITYFIGLSIGIHLLNLLAIPAIAYVYYFKKYKTTRNGFLFVGILSIIILAVIMYMIIPGVVWLSGMFELFFINSVGLPFNSGTIIYFALLIAAIIWAHHYTNVRNKPVLNSIVLGLIYLLIGYSSFFMLVIRSNANTPIDENSPEDAIALLSYLNREQYGSYPLFYGQYYNAPVVDYADANPIYVKDAGKGRYVITDNRESSLPVYDTRFETIFPRMWSNQKNDHIRYYKEYGKIKGKPVSVRKQDGSTGVEYCPTFIENMRFFFTYQLGHMYFRYFMWNFAGRQNNVESQGEPENGNWISGISFIDNARLGNQDELPVSQQSPAKNKFYFLPLLLGLAGLFYQLNRSRKDTWVVALLFIMTGIAIVIYLNQYPLQPRERDYAYAGSFYAFAIWIGLGVMSLYEALSKRINRSHAVQALAVSLICLFLVPGIMAREGWDDHNRSHKYAARDFAMNYLKGCDPQSVLITFGDNDTFPLWYVQEVENYRTDVRTLNHMLASGYWYAQQMFSRIYDSEALPLTLSREQYQNGVNNYVPIIEAASLADKYTELIELIRFVANEDDRTKVPLSGGRKYNYLPTRKVRLTVDSAKCVENGIVPAEMADRIVPYIEWEIKQNALFKNDLLVLDYLATSNWERALYFANPSSLLGIMGFDEYLHQEGMVYKFMPVKSKNFYQQIGGVNEQKTFEIFTQCQWGNLNDPRVTIDRESMRNSRLPRQNYLRAAEVFRREGDNEKAIALLDTCLYFFPAAKFPYDALMMPFAEVYYAAGASEKANYVMNEMVSYYSDDLRYYSLLEPALAEAYYSSEYQRAQAIMNRLGQIARANKEPELGSRIDSLANMYAW